MFPNVDHLLLITNYRVVPDISTLSILLFSEHKNSSTSTSSLLDAGCFDSAGTSSSSSATPQASQEQDQHSEVWICVDATWDKLKGIYVAGVARLNGAQPVIIPPCTASESSSRTMRPVITSLAFYPQNFFFSPFLWFS